MISINAVIQKFDKKGEKSGWWYIEIPAAAAAILHDTDRRSFRVKGKLDEHAIGGVALLPMGEGNYILPLNAQIRKGIKKKKGATLKVSLETDNSETVLPPGFMECLEDEPEAKTYFDQMKNGERNYFIKWIASAKTEQTQSKRIALCINAFLKGQDFGSMIRQQKAM